MRIRVGKNNLPVGILSNFVINTLGIPVPGLARDVICRMHETDPEVFSQIFIRNEYKHGFLPDRANVILDAGANVGYSVLFFNKLYPEATIIALEPDPRNYDMLVNNCSHLSNVILLKAALWNKCTRLELKFVGDTGHKLGSFAVRTVEKKTGEAGAELTEAFDVPTLMSRYSVETIDICKVDIEGAEKEVFGNIHAAWYDQVKLFILETHEAFAKGSDAAVKAALPAAKWQYAKKGENQFFKRADL
jgi:FkbM family methyltransferase